MSAARAARLAAALLVLAMLVPCPVAAAGIAGRWDVTFTLHDGRQRPAWLEIEDAPGGYRARMVGFYGAPLDVERFQVGDGELRIDAQGGGLPTMQGRVHGSWLEGTALGPQLGARGPFPTSPEVLDDWVRSLPMGGMRWTAVRQPLLPAGVPHWGPTIALFDGHDLDGWRTRNGTMAAWTVQDGVLRGLGGADLVSTRRFRDFKLHVECRLPEGGDSGIHLRGRYEIQLKRSATLEPPEGRHACVYGFVAAQPADLPPGPGGWDTFDITLIGRRVTVVLNGTPVIADQVIPGITGDALDADEGRPGPIMLQGYLGGGIEFRRVDITPAR